MNKERMRRGEGRGERSVEERRQGEWEESRKREIEW